MNRCRTIVWTVLFGVVSVTPLAGQGTRLAQLTSPEVLFDQDFTNIVSVHEFRDGGVLVSDSHERRVYVLDPTSRGSRVLGREGQGPGEYLAPTFLLPLIGDSVAVNDFGNSRLLVVRPDRTFGDFLLPRGCAQVPAGVSRLSTAETSDGSGRFYGVGPQVGDVRAIERWTVGSCDRVTIAQLPRPVPPGATVTGGAVMVLGGAVDPFPVRAQWSVARDGTVAIVHPDPYRVDLIRQDGTRVTGATIRTDAVRVTEAHRAKWRAGRLRPSLGLVMPRGGGPNTVTMSTPSAVREPDRWPEVMPPFLDDALLFDLDGRLWVRRTTPSAEGERYDVIDRTGALRGWVDVAPGARIVGFGRASVFVVRRDEFELEYLERHRYPLSL